MSYSTVLCVQGVLILSPLIFIPSTSYFTFPSHFKTDTIPHLLIILEEECYEWPKTTTTKVVWTIYVCREMHIYTGCLGISRYSGLLANTSN